MAVMCCSSWRSSNDSVFIRLDYLVLGWVYILLVEIKLLDELLAVEREGEADLCHEE